MCPGWQPHQDGGLFLQALLGANSSPRFCFLSWAEPCSSLHSKCLFLLHWLKVLTEEVGGKWWQCELWLGLLPVEPVLCMAVQGCFEKWLGPSGVAAATHLIAWLWLYLQSPNQEGCSTEEIILPEPHLLLPRSLSKRVFSNRRSSALCQSLQLPSAGLWGTPWWSQSQDCG